ncbi:MAG: hypothetical protein ACYC18_08200 [Gammaproteobacteria bacterium]
MRHSVVGLLLLAAVCGPLIGGCSAIGGLYGHGTGSAWAAIPSTSDRGADSVAELLAYVEELQQMSPQQLDVEFHSAKERFVRTPDGSSRLRLVVLLTLPDAPFHDDDRAIGLLNGYLDAPAGEPAAMRNFAAFLRRMIKRHQAEAANLSAEQQRSDLLQRKIDEIKSIEKSINDRGKPSVPELK